MVRSMHVPKKKPVEKDVPARTNQAGSAKLRSPFTRTHVLLQSPPG
jgi:hypothetical protein